MTRSIQWSVLLAAGAIACSTDGNKGDSTDDTGLADDTGPTVYEEGCITVDGSGGYAWINDAIEVASDGSTIELCASSAHEEAVVVDKGVSIVAPGPEYFILVAPTNMPGIEITAGGASVSGMAISSTRSGIEVTDASDVTLTDIQVVEAGTWGIKTKDATGVVIDSASLLGNAYGGVQADGGSVTLTGSTLSSNTGYGLRATGGAEVTLEGNTITGTEMSGADKVTDGVGVYLDDYSSAVTTDNTLTGNILVGLLAETADLDMSGDEVDGSLYGIVALYGSFEGDNLTVTDSYSFGIWAISQQEVLLSATTVTADPDDSASYAYDEWSGDDGGIGVSLFADDSVLSDVTVEGFNNCGVLVVPYDSSATTSLDSVTIANTGRYGLYLENADATLTDIDISGVRDPDDTEDTECYNGSTINLSFIDSVYAYQSSIDWTGGSISDSEGWGASLYLSNLAVEGVEFSGGECLNIVTYESSLTAIGNTFTGALEYGQVGTFYSVGDYLSGNTFSGNQYEGVDVQEYDYWKEYGYRYSYTYYDMPQLLDVWLYFPSDATLEDNTFEQGDAAVMVYGDATLTGNSFSDYRAEAVLAYPSYDDSGDIVYGTVEVSDSTFEQIDSRALYCSTSTLEVQDVVIQDGGVYGYTYDYYFESSSGGVTSYTQVVESPYSSAWFNGCNVTMDGVEFSNLNGGAVYIYAYSYDGTYELNDVDIETVNTHASAYDSAIYYYGYNADTEILLSDVSISDVQAENAVEVYPYYRTDYGYEPSLTLYAEGLQIDGVASNGVYINGEAATVEISSSDISNASSYGIYAVSGDLVLGASEVQSSGSSGVYLSGTTGTITGNTITANGTYGMECAGATFDDCSDNDLSGNTMGEHSGCDDSCGEAATSR